MPIDYEGSGVLRAFGPKVGESKEFHIRESVKVEDPTGASIENFKSTVKNWGYRYELTLTNGRIFTLNVWKLFFAFKEPVNAELDDKGNKVPVQDGDKIRIDHVGTADYKVTVLEKGTGINLVVEDTEKIAYEAKKAAEREAAPAPTASAPVATPPVAKAAPAVAAPVTPAVAAPVAPVTPPVTPAGEKPKLDLPF